MRRIWVFPAVITLAATGCGSGGSAALELAGSDALSTIPGEEYIYIDDIAPETDTLVSDWIAREEEVATCMRQEGFDYAPRTIQIEYPDESRLLTALEFAERFGYGIGFDDAGTGIQVTITAPTVPEDLFDEFQRAMFDTPACGASHSDPQVEDIVEAARFGSLNSLEADQIQRILASSEYIEAESEWIACMGNRGHDVRSLGEAYGRAEEAYEGISEDERLQAQAFEQRMATDDLECSARTTLEVIDQALKR